MGWWSTNKQGVSLLSEDTGMLWGDSVADVMDSALAEIVQIFVDDVGRKPTVDELLAGVKFAAPTAIVEEE